MSEKVTETAEEKEAKLKAFFERARKGVLTFLDEKGGSLPMGELHDHSLKKYFIQHQGFSRMMETFVDEELVEFDHMTQVTGLTEKGKEFIQ